jgi:hypothetical protein
LNLSSSRDSKVIWKIKTDVGLDMLRIAWIVDDVGFAYEIKTFTHDGSTILLKWVPFESMKEILRMHPNEEP